VPPSRQPHRRGYALIAHRDFYTSIYSDEPFTTGGVFDALWDHPGFLQWIYTLLTPLDYEDYWEYIAKIPVGDTGVAVDVEGAGIPELANEEIGPITTDVLESSGEQLPPSSEDDISWETGRQQVRQAALRDEVIDSNGEVVDTTSPWYVEGITQAGIRYMENKQGAQAALEEIGSTGILDELNEDGDMSIYSDIDAAIFGGGLPGGAEGDWSLTNNPFTNFGVDFGGAPPANLPPNGGNGGSSLPVPYTGGGGGCAPKCASPVYKKVCGAYKWVIPKRRRRKMLVTQGDLKGLAALKGVLGGGKAFETWIATHS